jgi:hypothetical protein
LKRRGGRDIRAEEGQIEEKRRQVYKRRGRKD